MIWGVLGEYLSQHFGTFSSCDLAGSERIKKTKAEGERLSEAQHINFSLLELGCVNHHHHNHY